VVPDLEKKTLHAIAIPNIDGTAHIMTDGNPSYEGLAKHFASHHVIDHNKTFVRSIILHTNFAESYHSLIKRAIFGSYHHVNDKHLPRYLREFEFRWNRRKMSDGERVVDAFAGSPGKRLLYRRPSQK
jgi:transposase-like protein